VAKNSRNAPTVDSAVPKPSVIAGWSGYRRLAGRSASLGRTPILPIASWQLKAPITLLDGQRTRPNKVPWPNITDAALLRWTVGCVGAMPGQPIDRLHTICLALPEAVEKERWGNPTFRVRGKIFALVR